MECIEKILTDIEVGGIFDSHYVVSILIRDFSDDYLGISQNIKANGELTLRTHQKIGHLISSFEGKLVERQPMQSWSLNIHGTSSSCALWKRI